MKNLNKLKKLKFGNYESGSALNCEFISEILQTNRESLKKFYLVANLARMDWIPRNCAIELKKLKLNFPVIGNTELFGLTTTMRHKLLSVDKLILHLPLGPDNGWIVQIFNWIINHVRNLRKLVLRTANRVTLANLRLLLYNTPHLIKLEIFGRNWISKVMSKDAKNWFKQDHSEFIKVKEFKKNLKILINQPLPNNLFD